MFLQQHLKTKYIMKSKIGRNIRYSSSFEIQSLYVEEDIYFTLFVVNILKFIKKIGMPARFYQLEKLFFD